MSDHTLLIEHTQNWLSNVIIEHNLCPFAKREYDTGRIHYGVIEASDLQSQLEQISTHCAALDSDANIETTLLIFPTTLSDFEDYLDMLDIANVLLKDQGYEGIYQLASFHPNYRFEGTDDDDPSNYTNRSPYPIIHILRETSIEIALETYPNPEKIPERNIALMEDLGIEVMQGLLVGCYK